MRIIKPDKPLTTFPVECQAIAQAMWLFLADRNLLHNKPDGKCSPLIDKESYTVQCKQIVQTGIIFSTHLSKLSYDDNLFNCSLDVFLAV